MLYWGVFGWKKLYSQLAASLIQSVWAAVKKPATMAVIAMIERAKISWIMPWECVVSGGLNLDAQMNASLIQSVGETVKKPATIDEKAMIETAKISGIIPEEYNRRGIKQLPAWRIILPPRMPLRE